MKTVYFAETQYTVTVTIEVEVETKRGRVVGSRVILAKADGDLEPPFDGTRWIGPDTENGILEDEIEAADGNRRKVRRLEEKADEILKSIENAIDNANWGNPSMIDVP